jgi:mono/diheme cytochrome c family protein
MDVAPRFHGSGPWRWTRTAPRAVIGALALVAAVVGIAGADGDPTFNREVVRIFQQHCQECHRTGGSAPFPLLAYDQAFRRRDKILESVSARSMPPWRPVVGYGDLAGARRLSPEDIATIRRWVETGAREGDAADRPAPRAFDVAASRGTPELVVPRPTTFTAPPRSGDIYRCFSIPTSAASDRVFSVAEVVPGNPRLVHHMLAMVDASGASAHMKATDGLPGYPCFGGPGVRIDGYLGGWTPGSTPWVMPEGVGIRLPANARIVVQMHYHNARVTPETDRTELRLYAAKTPVTRRLQFMRVGRFALEIPAGEARHEIEAGTMVHRPMSLIAMHPHMHLLGREMKVWARMKDESIQPLIHIDDWDFNWQGFYFFTKPVALPVGSWIELTAAWDNSAANSRNPHQPPQVVRWGERTTDEMGHTAILFTFDDERSPSASP